MDNKPFKYPEGALLIHNNYFTMCLQKWLKDSHSHPSKHDTKRDKYNLIIQKISFLLYLFILISKNMKSKI